MLGTYYYLRSQAGGGLKHTPAIQLTSDINFISRPTAFKIVKLFEEKGEIEESDTSGRGHGSAKFQSSFSPGNLTSEDIMSVKDFIQEKSESGVNVTVKMITHFLHEDRKITIAPRTMNFVLKNMGYVWGRMKKGKLLQNEDKKFKRIRPFLVLFSQAQTLEREGDFVILWLDESYVNTNHASSYSWFNPKSKHSNLIGRKSGAGRRIIIVHAITQHGLLSACRPLTSKPITEPHATAEWLWEAQKRTGDYHKNMNAESFMDWVNNRLLPAFSESFPGKKPIVILDNASYHWGRDEEFINFSYVDKSSGRQQLVDFYKKEIRNGSFVSKRGKTNVKFEVMKTKSVSFFDISNEGDRQMIRNEETSFWSFGRRGTKISSRSPNKKIYPNREDLKQYVKKWALENKPSVFKTQLQKVIESLGGYVIFLPPYCPEFNPIELVWANVKRKVASFHENNRTIDMLLQQTSAAFNGGTFKTKSGTMKTTQGVQQSVLGYVNHAINELCKAAESQKDIMETLPGFNGLWKYPLANSNQKCIMFGGGWDPEGNQNQAEWTLGSVSVNSEDGGLDDLFGSERVAMIEDEVKEEPSPLKSA